MIKANSPIKRTKLNWFQYWIGHCWMSGWQSIRIAFRIWADLMTSNYKNYALLKTDDPETECMEWFWVSLGEDDVYPREFLEYLQDLCIGVQNGEVELISFNLDEFKESELLLNDLQNEVNDD